MGTKALTQIKDIDSKTIINLYTHLDGYPSGHGKALKDFLITKKIVNGIPVGKDISKLANGMGCLSAQLIAHLKKEVGQHYLQPISNEIDDWIDYVYTIYLDTKNLININIEENTGKFDVIYDGLLSDFNP